MSETQGTTVVQYPIMTDDTGRAIAAALHVMAHDKAEGAVADMATLARMSRDGLGEFLLGIGDKVVTTWTDPDSEQEYDVDNDVVHFPGEVVLQDGETAPGIILQWHYTLPFGTQFDEKEAFYYRDMVIPAMDALRGDLDLLETMTDTSVWPFPTYGKLLFGII